MANRSIDTSIRKPRRAKGTPVFFQRNIVAVGTLVFGGVCWYLYNLLPQAQRIKQSIRDGKFKQSPELQQHVLSMKLGTRDANIIEALNKLRARQLQKQYEEQPKPQPWYSKILSSRPEL